MTSGAAVLPIPEYRGAGDKLLKAAIKADISRSDVQRQMNDRVEPRNQ